jgi:Zn-dependent metalloprotease
VKYLKQGVCLALLGAGLAAVPGIQAAAAGATGGGSMVEQMRDTAQGSVALSTSSATGKVGFIRAGKGGDLMPGKAAQSSAQAAAKATSYLDDYASAFGARPDELVQGKTMSTPYGWTVTYTQAYHGVPVFGSMLKANIDRDGDLTSVNGYAAPGLSLSTTPRFSASQAASRAVAFVKANPAEGVKSVSGLKATGNQLVVYRMGAVKGEAGTAVLAHQVEVSNGTNVRDAVFVDATTGKVFNRYSMTDTALERHLYETDLSNEVWHEGEPTTGLNEDQVNLVDTAGDSYWFYNNTWGRDSYDGAGAPMKTVNNDPTIQCPNANWNGVTTNYCDGVTSDDVVAHEWGHAYTEYTSGLIYQWQSGALNESYSDVWGETIDLINARDDDGEGDIDAARTVGQCSTHSPPTPVLTVNSPVDIAGECLTGGYLGPNPMPTVQGDVIAPTDEDEDGSDVVYTTTDGCSPYDGSPDASGKVVLVDRGGCTFVQKANVAKDAGADALIIGNRDEAPVGFSDGDTTLPPTVSIGLSDRQKIRDAITDGDTVNVTIEDGSGTREDSYRWLIGEKSPAFGGAIRDMWVPTCYGDPGKVSDAEYKCSTDDQGGVHSNSGVPNHAYALLVDGGTYNGVDVTGIGLDKAAQIWWRAQTAYLTPTSDFGDMANALDSSCLSLVGEDIQELSVTPDSPGADAEKITTGDCLSVSSAVLATELRKDPTAQCDFQPLLAQDTPAACGAGSAKTVWKETFNSGLGDWKQSEEVVYKKGHGVKWKGGVAPDHGSLTAYAPDPQGGNCGSAVGNLSSSNSLISPKITMPKKGAKNGRLTFNHYVATELGYDGGNVKISVNGGAFKLVKPGAFEFNSYNASLASADEGNSNPLASQPGFTGTDGGKTTGTWGQSQINLSKLNIGKKDTFKIRFDFGRDGCGGNDGWYVDDVTVQVCKNVATRHQELGTKS